VENRADGVYRVLNLPAVLVRSLMIPCGEDFTKVHVYSGRRDGFYNAPRAFSGLLGFKAWNTFRFLLLPTPEAAKSKIAVF
jgi:hypothetical protein